MFLLATLCGAAFAVEWRPIDPSEIAQKTPRVDPAADAEAIFWDVRIEDKFDGNGLSLTMNHYIRIKIFTERGKEQFATVEIPRIGGRDISGVAARTIKADGTIVELKKDSIFDRELAQAKHLKLRGKTFALPNVEVGDIIEYQYKEHRNNEIASHMRLYFQREIPMWNVAYHLKPLSIPMLPWGMRTMAFQCQLPPFRKEPNGFFTTSLNNVPAFKSEPYMPPEDQVRAWVLIYYEEDKKIEPEKFWKDIGKADFARFKPLIKADDAVKRLAVELTSGAQSPEDKLAALDAFCRTKIRDLWSNSSHATAEERKAVKENHSPSDTLKQKSGRGMDLNYLFAALATAAGFDARMARISDRGDIFFHPQRTTTYFMESFSVAVKVGDRWTFFDPSTSYLERGMLRWQEEGSRALISDPKEGFFVDTQYSGPQRSKRARKATFKLLEDGGLKGSVEYSYTGHVAERQKREWEDMTPAQQEDDWKDSTQRRLGDVEISAFTSEGGADPFKAVTVRHEINVPGYATRTGRRILFQPAFFQRNVAPRFSESARQWDLYFEYGWAEEDEVTIDLPDGWELDQPVKPSSVKIGEIGEYMVEVRKTIDGRKLIYRRRFEWGRNQLLLFPASEYERLKKVFDRIQEQDRYTISLKETSSGN
jgi:hypothetical protein